ncbi:MAG: hypothetical protein ACRDFB_08440 [Rhabdochlamydiaceae bacterium]
MREHDPQLARFQCLDPLTNEFPTFTPYQYSSNDPVANIDKDELDTVGLTGITVSAKAVNRISAFSSFTSSILGATNLLIKLT